jgi:tetratricopeptide (TPR) repeat protein
MLDYDQALDLDPRNVRAYIDRADIHRHFFQYPRAIKDYNQAIRLDPDNAQAYYKRGVTHMIYCYKMRLD